MTNKKINTNDYVDFCNLINEEDTGGYSVDGRVRIMIESSEFDKYIETYVDNKRGDVELTIWLDFNEDTIIHYPEYAFNNMRHHVLTKDEYAKLLTMRYVFDCLFIEFYVDTDSCEFKIMYEI